MHYVKINGRGIPVPSQSDIDILCALSEQDQTGLALVNKGLIARGSVYVMLQRMAADGLIEGRAEPRPEKEGGLPYRVYAVTPFGARLLQAWQGLLTVLDKG